MGTVENIFCKCFRYTCCYEEEKIKEKGQYSNIPWVNRKVKAKLFKRDAFKRKAIQTNKKEDWLLCRSSKNAALRCTKKGLLC